MGKERPEMEKEGRELLPRGAYQALVNAIGAEYVTDEKAVTQAYS